jgi:hypothetical protein
MIPILLVPALVQAAPSLPPDFKVPEGLQIKPGSLQVLSYDLETFEVRPPGDQAPVRVPVKGRAWRFILESSGVRMGVFSLLQKLKPSLEAGGWAWQWEQRGVARREVGGQEYWIKASPSGGAALQVVLIRQGSPRTLTLVPPGKAPEIPAPDSDFPYLAPWPGAQLVVSTPAQPGPPVVADVGDGRQGFLAVTWIEKEYNLSDPPSPYEFVTSYRQALEAAGWEIEGDQHGSLVQIQAIYLKDGRDIRLTLRLVGDAMAVSVADVGAQRPK